jgi:hypothetical protein
MPRTDAGAREDEQTMLGQQRAQLFEKRMGETEYLAGHSADVLTEANLSSLYSVPMKRVAFEHGGRQIETLAPVLSQLRSTPRPDANAGSSACRNHSAAATRSIFDRK